VTWIYEGRELTEEVIDGFVGMVYLIENLEDGRKYVGKKIFKFARRRKIKGRLRRVVVDSDYKKYYGSNEELKAEVARLGPASFSRIVLRLCLNKSEMNYYEAKEQFERDVLLDHTYYNTWIQVKVRRSGALGVKDE
jgi:hypothetical protein